VCSSDLTEVLVKLLTEALDAREQQRKDGEK
jgi:hypothetical protein